MAALDEPTHLDVAAQVKWRRNRRAVLLMLFAGLRLSEVAALRSGDVDFDVATLIVRNGKGGKVRFGGGCAAAMLP